MPKTIASDLQATAIEAFWTGTGFLLASTVVQPIFTSLSHIFGRLPLFLTALTFFTLGTILGGVALTVPLLLAARAIQGVGAGAMLTLTYVITTDLVSLRERGKWFGLISLSWAVGSIVGPIIGGSLAQKNWYWLFWINLPFCGIAYILLPLTLRLRPVTGSITTKLRAFDWVGAGLFVASLTVFLVPLSWGGVQFAWESAATLVPLLLGLAGLVVFALHISFSRRLIFRPLGITLDPLIRPSLFGSLTANAAYVATVLHGIIVWMLLYYLPLFMEMGKGQSPSEAGVSLISIMATVAPAAVVVGLIIARTGRYRELVWIGWATTILGSGLLTLLRADTPTAHWVAIFLVVGLGLGILYSAQSFAIQAAARSAEDLPFAAGLYAFFRNLGQSIGVAVGGVVFQNELRRRVAADPRFARHADEWSRDASALVVAVHALKPEQKVIKDFIVEAYVDALRSVWVLMIIISSVSFVIALVGIKHKELDTQLKTEQGLVEKRPRKGLDGSGSGSESGSMLGKDKMAI